MIEDSPLLEARNLLGINSVVKNYCLVTIISRDLRARL